DEPLVKKVREAVEKKTAIDKIEAFVGGKAVINTIRQEDKALFSRVSIRVDPKESHVATLRGAKHVVYWMHSIKSNDATIVGVVWTADNEMKVFFGVVLPP